MALESDNLLPRIKVCVASRGNEFMIDIARLFVAGFVGAGAECKLVFDEQAILDDGWAAFVVAPHEFFPLFAERVLSSDRLAAFRAASVLLNVEQPGSQWFETAVWHGRAARLLFDLHAGSTVELTRRGLRALHAPLGYAEHLTHAPVERDIDLFFLGIETERRANFFARYGEILSRYRCKILFTRVGEIRTTSTPGYVSGDQRIALCARSRVLLNIHAQSSTYFESHRALLAAANGCALATEVSEGSEPFVAGNHLAMGDFDDLPRLCMELLENEDKRVVMANRALELVTHEHRMDAICNRILATISDLGESTPAAHPSDAGMPPRVALECLQNRATAAVSTRARGVSDKEVETNRAFGCVGSPCVSVVVPLYNYERYIDECMRSVERSEAVPSGFELVVVDDCSSDGSRDRVRAFMLESELPTKLVCKHTNTGLGDTRNQGWQEARAPYVFFLDADNYIHARCLRVLYEAVQSECCAAAYGLIRTYEDGTGRPLGLISAHAWSVRDLVRAPSIDAMAMIERRVLEEVGGYSTALLQHGWQGWEDYDLWLTLADAGHRAVRVPEVLSSYRVHPGSMIWRTNQDTASIARHFERKFANLAAQFPELNHRFGFPVSVGGRPAHATPIQPNLDSRCRSLEHELEAVYASKSWSITAPLRTAYELLQRLPVGRKGRS